VPPTTAAPEALAATYSTLPDGSPSPIIAVFNNDAVTLTGAVPDEASKEKLAGLAAANSKFPVPVNNLLTIDPTVPMGIGVRVVELTSARFPTGSSKISPEHGQEIDRVVNVMNLLPNVTALVIGHSDQIGNSAANFKLSADRAAAVVDYMVFSGINPERLASRAVGDTDLLTLNDDAASLALNRRTEFVLYGLLSA
jgi:outer membrane protein OmpA-like peptidoglycan-associated protein